jgi:SAM-dependent methyltransferase
MKRFYRTTVTTDDEIRRVVEFVRSSWSGPSKECRVLDVGCGNGRYLRKLGESGFDMTGVDTNQELVQANRKAGLHCITSDEFARTQDTYDVMLMSHVIEHFSPKDLVPFLDGYLDRLKAGGRLIIATPLLTRLFYDDFDHVKPYHPMGLLMVFGDKRAQVQYYARNTLCLEDVWIRRGHWRFAHRRARYINSAATRLMQAVEFVSALAFRLSGGLIGQADGWVGMFQKVDHCDSAADAFVL